MNYTGSNPPNNPKTTSVAIIPARFGSVRLPGKVLLEIAGKPMICHVVERAREARSVSRVIVATDDDRIRKAVESAGHECVMTRADHTSGTDRVAEVASSLDAELIVNVQGDEPCIAPETIDRAIAALIDDDECGIATTWESMESPADVLSPDVVKIVVDGKQRAIYFSRSAIPYPNDEVRRYGSLQQALQKSQSLLARFRKHTGLYVYRREVLLELANWEQTRLEQAEALEQLRALEHGVKIKAVEASAPSIGIDTAEDLSRVRSLLNAELHVSR